MQLADKGLVDIDAPITDYIPNFRMADPRYTGITVRMLMNHTSGIMGTQFANMELYNDNYMVSNDELNISVKTERINWQILRPGNIDDYIKNLENYLRSL